MATTSPLAAPTALILFDGVCALCHGVVRFVLPRDRRGYFHFAPLQSQTARTVLERHGRSADDLDTIQLVLDYGGPNERVLDRSRAVFAVLAELGGIWAWVAQLRHLPQALTDLGYRIVAGSRYRVFGQYDACPLPPPEWRGRFLGD